MSIRLLIAEDQPGLQRVLALSFPEPEFQTQVTGNGAHALSLALAGSFDILILDMMLPGMSGLHVCSRLRNAPNPSGVKIIMLTARKQQSDRIAALAAGVDHFMGKPFSVPILRDLVRSMVAPPAQAPENMVAGDSFDG